MAYFKLEYIDNQGKRTQKTVNLVDETQLQTYVQTANLNLTNVERLSEVRRYLDIRRLFEGVKLDQVIEILESLQVIVRSGLPMNTALLDLANDADNNVIRDMLNDISYSIQMSMSLSEAMGKYEKIFGESTIGLIRIGEETGELENTITDAARYMKRISDLRSKLKNALVLPIITLIALSGAFIYWIGWVLPSLMSMLESFDVELPALTRGLVALSGFLRSNGLLLVIGIVAFIFGYITLRRKSEKFRYATDLMLLKSPILGITLKYYYYAFVAEYIRLMIAAGLPLYQALSILHDSIANRIYKIGIGNTREGIGLGKSFSEALAEEKMFSSLIIRMINVGEQTGRLEGQLEYVSNYYFAKVDYRAENIANIIQPVITVILGAFIIILLLGFLGPIWDLIAAMSSAR